MDSAEIDQKLLQQLLVLHEEIDRVIHACQADSLRGFILRVQIALDFEDLLVLLQNLLEQMQVC